MEDSLVRCLPQEITSNIFSRLPVESVLDCKLVCRSWRDILQFHADTHFAYQHLLQQHGPGLSKQAHDHPLEPDQGNGNASDSAPMGFVIFHGYGSLPNDLYYAEYHEGDKISDPSFTTKRIRINFNFLKDVSRIVGSCNGLICLSVKRIYNSKYKFLGPGEPFYICNPVTREIVNLPGLLIHKKKYNEDVRIAHGFGYHSLTKEYKVVRICYYGDPNNKPSKGEVEVYTLGSGRGWRYIGETSYYLCSKVMFCFENSGVWYNSALYWLHEASTVVAFDLVREVLEVFPTPTGRSTKPKMRRLHVFRGSLCHVSEYVVENDLEESELWVLKKNKEDIDNTTNTRNHTIRLHECKPGGVPKWVYWCVSHRLFAFTRQGEILLQAENAEVNRYNLESRTLKPVSHINRHRGRGVPISHTNSFVSLKALGETTTKVFEESPCDEEISCRPRRNTKRFKSAATSEDR